MTDFLGAPLSIQFDATGTTSYNASYLDSFKGFQHLTFLIDDINLFI
jgi:hypothetical protein